MEKTDSSREIVCLLAAWVASPNEREATRALMEPFVQQRWRSWMSSLVKRYYFDSLNHSEGYWLEDFAADCSLLVLRWAKRHPAERLALQGLGTLARLAQRRAWSVFMAAPGDLPLLEKIPAPWPRLVLLHRASRLLNLDECLHRAAPHETLFVLAAPIGECASLSLPQDFSAENVPAEEPAYCESLALKIMAKYQTGANDHSETATALKTILAEAGIAGVAVPFTLLARHLRLAREDLMALLQSPGLAELICWPQEPAATDQGTVAFGGRWLAEKIAPPSAKPGDYPHLVALLQDCEATAPHERFFFLNLLVALCVQGRTPRAMQLLKEYYHRFHDNRQLAGPAERQAWGLFHRHHLLPQF